jgi:hypothetical protein
VPGEQFELDKGNTSFDTPVNDSMNHLNGHRNLDSIVAEFLRDSNPDAQGVAEIMKDETTRFEQSVDKG